MIYILLTEEFVNSNNGYHLGSNTFNAYRIERGQYKDQFACSYQSSIDFPELFDDLEFETVELTAEDFEVDYSPPASNGKGIVIPEKYQWIFPVHVGGYTIELKESNGVLYAEESCLGWTAFVREIRKPENIQYRATIIPVWNYGLTEAERIDL